MCICDDALAWTLPIDNMKCTATDMNPCMGLVRRPFSQWAGAGSLAGHGRSTSTVISICRAPLVLCLSGWLAGLMIRFHVSCARSFYPLAHSLLARSAWAANTSKSKTNFAFRQHEVLTTRQERKQGDALILLCWLARTRSWKLIDDAIGFIIGS